MRTCDSICEADSPCPSTQESSTGQAVLLAWPVPNVQNTPDSRKIAIDKVGIKVIHHPVQVMDKIGGVQHTIATFNMYMSQPHHFKGTHMSRFIEILNVTATCGKSP